MSIHKKILEIRKEVKTIPKNGWNDFHKYEYAEANDVVKTVKPIFNEHGVNIYPIGVEDLSVTAKQKVVGDNVIDDGYIERWTQIYELVDTESETSKVVKVRCAGEDKGDKSAYKGNTGALKYLFIDLLLLDTEDDPERTPNKTSGSNNSDDDPNWLNKTYKNSDELTDDWKKVVKRLKKNPDDLDKVYKHYAVNKKNRQELEQLVEQVKSQ